MTTPHPDAHPAQPTGYPQTPGYPQASGYPQPPRPRKTGPKIMTFSAIALLLAGVIAGAVGGVRAFGGLTDLIPSDLVTAEGTAGSDALAMGPSTEDLSFDASAEGAYLVFETSQESSAQLPLSAVSAEGPSGPVSLEPTDESGSISFNDWSVFGVGMLIVSEPGPYTLSVDEQVAADDVSLVVGSALNADSFTGIGGSGLLLLGGLLVGGLGFVLLIAGVIWWAVAKK